MSNEYPDSHGSVFITNECVCITFPVTGWYRIPGSEKEVYFKAGDQLILNGPYYPPFPQTGDTRSSK